IFDAAEDSPLPCRSTRDGKEPAPKAGRSGKERENLTTPITLQLTPPISRSRQIACSPEPNRRIESASLNTTTRSPRRFSSAVRQGTHHHAIHDAKHRHTRGHPEPQNSNHQTKETRGSAHTPNGVPDVCG